MAARGLRVSNRARRLAVADLSVVAVGARDAFGSVDSLPERPDVRLDAAELALEIGMKLVTLVGFLLQITHYATQGFQLGDEG